MPPKGMSWADMVRGKGSGKDNGGAKGGAKGRSTESPPSTPEMEPDKTEAPSASNDLGPRKGNKGASKGKHSPPKTSGKGNPPSSPEPQEKEETSPQEPEPAYAPQSAGAEESQRSSKASSPRQESAQPSAGSCSVRSSELSETQEPEPAEPAEPAQLAKPAQQADESSDKKVLTGWAKLFEGGPSAADLAPRKGNKGTSKGKQNPGWESKGSRKGGRPSTLEPAPKITEAASALGAECKPASVTRRDDSPHVSADSSSASSSGPPEPAQEAAQQASIQAVNRSEHAIAGLESFQDRDGSEDLSNERLELDTFDYRTYYMNDLRTRDSDTEPTIYGSDSESSDEGF